MFVIPRLSVMQIFYYTRVRIRGAFWFDELDLNIKDERQKNLRQTILKKIIDEFISHCSHHLW
jgi:hypothetical protein